MDGAENRQSRALKAAEGLASLDLAGLRGDWRQRWEEPPRYRSRDLMLRAATYRLQAEALSPMTAATRRRMARLAEQFTADRTFKPTAGPVLKVGSSLIREWKGFRHEVVVTAEGFAYLGEDFRSLSRVAFRITGTKWNGLVFFGIKDRGAAR